jgi:hypothetical protein
MAQVVRVLAESDVKAPLEEMRRVLPPNTQLIVEDGDEHNWRQLLLKHSNGQEIALIERDPAGRGEIGEEVVHRLIHEMEQARPRSAVNWLRTYLPAVKVVYAMQVLGGAEADEGWLAVHRIQAYLWKKFGGILQADGEGFSNREGRHILWQFESQQEGELDVAVLDKVGDWIPFTLRMDVASEVEGFQRGEVPAEARH